MPDTYDASGAPPSVLPPPVDPPAPAPVSHQLPPHRNKVGRVGDHLAAVSADLREWAELRIALGKREVLDKKDEVIGEVKAKVEPLKFLIPAGVLALYLLGFALTTLAFAFAAALSVVVWGFALGFFLVTLLLALVVGGLALVGKKKLDESKRIDAKAKTRHIRVADEPAPREGLTTEQINALEAQKARQAAV